MHISENEDAYLRERRRIKTETQNNENAIKTAKKKNQNAKQKKKTTTRRSITAITQKNASALGHYTQALFFFLCASVVDTALHRYRTITVIGKIGQCCTYTVLMVKLHVADMPQAYITST